LIRDQLSDAVDPYSAVLKRPEHQSFKQGQQATTFYFWLHETNVLMRNYVTEFISNPFLNVFNASSYANVLLTCQEILSAVSCLCHADKIAKIVEKRRNFSLDVGFHHRNNCSSSLVG